MRGVDIYCPACYAHNQDRLFNGVCYACFEKTLEPKPEPIVTPCPRLRLVPDFMDEAA